MKLPIGSVPVPDPTVLTTAQSDALRDELLSAIHSLKELLETRLNGMDTARELLTDTLKERLATKITVIETRFDGMDKAIRILQDIADKFPARMDEKIAALSAVHEEKFDSVQTQFAERDVRIEQAAGAVKIAVDAALQAQKEAAGEANRSSAASISKSEASFTKQIDLLTDTIKTLTKAFDDKVADVKERVGRIEGGWGGASTVIGYVIAAVGLLIGLSRFLK